MYAFRIGDVVKEITVDRRPVIGKVIGFGSSAEHDFYKIASRGEVYGARDDEIELVRRGPTKARRGGMVDQFVMDWYGRDTLPAAGESCMIAWIGLDGEWRQEIVTWNGEEWEFEPRGDMPGLRIGMECVDAWAPWEWPEIGDVKEGGADDDAGCESEPDADPGD